MGMGGSKTRLLSRTAEYENKLARERVEQGVTIPLLEILKQIKILNSKVELILTKDSRLNADE